MLRITRETTRNDEAPVVLKLEGQLKGLWVEGLRHACTETLGSNGHRRNGLVLDLAGVLFLDADGIELFHDLAAGGVSFTNGSVFIAEQLKLVSGRRRNPLTVRCQNPTRPSMRVIARRSGGASRAALHCGPPELRQVEA
jgi:hypothetical protein